MAVLARLGDAEPLTAADLAVLGRLDDGPGWPDDDDRAGDVPGDGDAVPWLGHESGAPDAPAPPKPFPDLVDAGFTHRAESGGVGFAAGGTLDRMEACGPVGLFTDQVWGDGLGALTDDELVGYLCAQRRLAARATAGELAAVSELARRRTGPDGSPGEHVQDEVAAALTLTGFAAARLVALTDGVARLPGVAAALAAGRVDAAKAGVFADELTVVDDVLAAAIAALIVPEAPGMTTAQLRRALRREVLRFDPPAAARRKEKAAVRARVECWAEADGTGAIAGRDLDLARVIAADQQVEAGARWLRQQGVPGTLEQLRAEVFLARLAGQPLDSLIPQPAVADAASADPSKPALGGWVGPGGRVNLTIPAQSWLGWSDAPGEAGGYGPVDAGTCRDLAGALAAQPATRWCVTFVDRGGRAVAHGCARAGPGPPGTGAPDADRAAWLASVPVTPIAAGTCSHARQSAGYQPSAVLRTLVKVRSPRCGFPGCSRRAPKCDDDHTVPYHRGGKTCECNLYPLCRRHHRAKQAAGWRLHQPEPGNLTWTLPSGRQVSVMPEPYPR